MIKNKSVVVPGVSVAILILLNACSSFNPGDHLVSIDAFNVEKNLMENGEKVELLGVSDRLEKHGEYNFYRLAVVRSLKSGDTSCVFSPVFISRASKKTQFVNSEGFIGGLLAHNKAIIDEDEHIQQTISDGDIQSPQFNEVFVDPMFFDIDVTQFPATIGFVGIAYSESQN